MLKNKKFCLLATRPAHIWEKYYSITTTGARLVFNIGYVEFCKTVFFGWRKNLILLAGWKGKNQNRVKEK